MATIYLDKQSNNWKLKIEVKGKDKRIKLRKAFPGETNATKPPDVVALATAHGGVFSNKKEATDTQPDAGSIKAFVVWYAGDYATTRRPASVVRCRRIMKAFLAFIGNSDRPVSEVDYAFMKAFFDWRLSQGKGKVQAHTVISEFLIVQGVFRAAEMRDIIAKNPCRALMREVKAAFPSPTTIKWLFSQPSG